MSITAFVVVYVILALVAMAIHSSYCMASRMTREAIQIAPRTMITHLIIGSAVTGLLWPLVLINVIGYAVGRKLHRMTE